MGSLWQSLSAGVQDTLIVLGLLLPAIVTGTVVVRGYSPAALVRALMWRFRWINLIFVMLIAVSLGMGIALVAQERGLRKGTAKAADKFDLVVTAPGSEFTMMLASVFLQATDAPLLDGQVYREIAEHDHVLLAAPIAFGDSFKAAPIVGTIAAFVTHLTDDRLEGRMFANSSEAVIGSAVDLSINDTFVPAHGVGHGADSDAHSGDIHVVGRMPPGGTPWDNAIIVPIETIWEVHGMANGHAPLIEAYRSGDPEDHEDPEQGGSAAPVAKAKASVADEPLGPPFDPDYFPGAPAIIVQAESLASTYGLRSAFNRDAESMAFFPGTVLANLYAVMGDIRQAMSVMAVVTQILVASSVIMGLFILMQLLQRQLALLRAVGAPSRFIFAVIWSYAATLLAAGVVIGTGFGFAASMILSDIVSDRSNVDVPIVLGWTEIKMTAAFLGSSCLLSLIPAMIVLRQPLLKGLRT